MKRIVILISGRGSNMQAILEAKLPVVKDAAGLPSKAPAKPKAALKKASA